jgi:large subunit ribosomal protein L6
MNMPGRKESAASCSGSCTEEMGFMAVERRVAIPEGVTARIDGTVFSVSGPKGELSRNLRYPRIGLLLDGDELVVSTDSERKKILAMVGTLAAHANNMCTGVTEGFEYRMKVVYSHFPIQIKVSGTRLEIVNFLGEKESRFVRVDEGVDLKLGSDEITLSGIDKEAVGQTAARIEKGTKVRRRDPRVFQDGIYIVEKA